jgi:hypothetical protein
MVIRNFHIERITVFPTKANAPLIIDPNAPLPKTVAFQGFQVTTQVASSQPLKLSL